jgi:hypothetical protein
MKRIGIAFALASALAVSVSSQTPPSAAIRKVQVTAQALRGKAAGTPYVIDLTRRGTVYEVAAGIDYRRARVRTSTGEVAMSDLAKKLGWTGPFFLGTSRDLSVMASSLSPGGGSSQAVASASGGSTPAAGSAYTCGNWRCDCDGRKGCSDLSQSTLCNPNDSAWCRPAGRGSVSCSCLR